MEKKHLFFSHSWRPDNLFRDNHKRVVKLAEIMSICGWKCWIDEKEMFGNIDACIANGINNSECILVFITESYCNKINEAANNPNIRDNCFKEWTYANNRNKLMIPIIMEPCLLNNNYWPDGIINLYFGSTFYIDYTKDNINTVVKNLTILLNKYNIYSSNNIYPSNTIVKVYKIINFINKLKELKKKKEINQLPPSPVNGSPNMTPNSSYNKLDEESNEKIFINKNNMLCNYNIEYLKNNLNKKNNKVKVINNRHEINKFKILNKKKSIRSIFQC